jgi:predicted RNA binding protein YcfA (HicA-like mRNA interferase family)
MLLMGKQDLPGELDSQVLTDFVEEHGFVYEKIEGSHMIYRKPGYPRVSIPKHGVSTRRSHYVFKNILDATDTTRKGFVEWYRSR